MKKNSLVIVIMAIAVSCNPELKAVSIGGMGSDSDVPTVTEVPVLDSYFDQNIKKSKLLRENEIDKLTADAMTAAYAAGCKDINDANYCVKIIQVDERFRRLVRGKYPEKDYVLVFVNARYVAGVPVGEDRAAHYRRRWLYPAGVIADPMQDPGAVQGHVTKIMEVHKKTPGGGPGTFDPVPLARYETIKSCPLPMPCKSNIVPPTGSKHRFLDFLE